jgi:hypothetical protein
MRKSCCPRPPFFLSSLPKERACPMAELLRRENVLTYFSTLRYFFSSRLAIEQALFLIVSHQVHNHLHKTH